MRFAPGVHIYIADLTADLGADRRAQYLALLSAEEVSRRDRFVTPVLRDRYLVSHALMRCALSHHAPVAPCAWRFCRSVYGKPFVCASHGDAAGLQFNLSHDDQVAVVAICHGRNIGIDVELLSQNVALVDSGLVFADAERSFLRSVPQASRARCFLEHWTLKEACLKALGTGLSTLLPAVELNLSRSGAIGLRFGPALTDTADRWACFQYGVGSARLIALCVERKCPAEQPDVQISQLIPLEQAQPLAEGSLTTMRTTG